MSTFTAISHRSPARAGSAVVSSRTAFRLQISILVLFLAGSIAPTPLYSIYEARWGFSPITVTVVFGVYALAVLASLLIVGSLSDHIGRRPVLLAAIAVQAVAMVVFATAGGVPALLVARIVQGLSSGAALGALGAGLLDIDKPRGTIANGVGALAGTATGGIVSSLLVGYLPSPTRLVYLVVLAILVLQWVGVALMPESSTRKPGALASLRPQIGLPPAARRPMLLAVPALVAVWSLAGFYGSLGPTLTRLVAGSDSVVLGGLAMLALAGSAALTVLAVRNVAARRVMLFGTGTLAAGVAVTLVGVADSSTPAFFLGTAIAGVGFGAGFQGALRTVLPLAAPHERAGVLSIIYVVSYLGMGVPAVIAGLLVAHSGVIATAREYGLVVIGLAMLALIGQLTRRRTRRSPAAAPRCTPHELRVEPT
ncbi:MAG TPA: MFS transporter [Solirubrobacteraceae bacterium]|jgi:MFS family permease|nr:MFS transporter [Solirubrobacteraceae bacterium]